MATLPNRLQSWATKNRALLLSPSCWFALLLCAPPLPGIAGSGGGAPASFQDDVLRLFQQHCVNCHGGEKQKAGLRLDSVAAAFHGSQHGPVLVPGAPDQSLLIEAVRYENPDLEMPPDAPLSSDEIALLESWVLTATAVANGSDRGGEPGPEDRFTEEDRSWWAIQPLRDTLPPPVGDGESTSSAWPRHNAIDHFIQERLAGEGLEPAAAAEARAFIRRATFDLHGLPPSPEESRSFAEAFSRDPDKAVQSLVDRLLASPRYGERWARHWLDLVRYAESDGYRRDSYRPQAWRYRDYVIRSFNGDKPYTRFLTEQLAGDEQWPEDPDALVATGFLRHGVYEYNNRDAEGQWEMILNEVTDTVGDVFLGMGMACARCHDHKFDPILQEDYYRLQGFFRPMLWRDDLVLTGKEAKAAHQRRLEQYSVVAREAEAALRDFEAPFREEKRAFAIAKFPDAVEAMYHRPTAEKTPYEKQMTDLVERQVEMEYERLSQVMDKGERNEWQRLQKAVAAFSKKKPKPLPSAFAVSDTGGGSPPNHIPGDRRNRDIAPGFPAILGATPPEILNGTGPGGITSSGRRSALAQWLSAPSNPLTPRVIVNRIWHYHFGTGISASTSDFGSLGEEPIHPELLDWLASEFITSGWRIKPIHRLVMNSHTYRQSATAGHETAMQSDPSNRLYWKFPGRRLSAEQIRDAMLAVSGELGARDTGPPLSADRPARTVFTKVLRNSPDPLLASFDAPLGFGSTSERNVTTTPLQSLLLANGSWTAKRAGAMARDLVRHHGNQVPKIVQEGFERAYGRRPTPMEQHESNAFIRHQMRLSGDANQAELPPDAFIDDPQLHRWGTAFQTSDRARLPALTVPGISPASYGEQGFTIEAVVLLRSLYKDANVRTLVSHWDGDRKKRGWNLGVTSQTSRYLANHLVLQVVGDGEPGGRPVYEVLVSGIKIPLNTPYYIGASFEFGSSEVTFFARDMSYDESELDTTTVATSVGEPLPVQGIPLSIGERPRRGGSDRRSGWDGLIDDVRLTASPITNHGNLLINQPVVNRDTLGFWRFSRTQEGGILSGEGPDTPRLRPGNEEAEERLSPFQVAVTDFCHALLNSSEFLYTD